MCLDHHSLYDSKTKQHKNYTIHEVKDARSRLYDLAGCGKSPVLNEICNPHFAGYKASRL
jgi:hypothetical protein